MSLEQEAETETKADLLPCAIQFGAEFISTLPPYSAGEDCFMIVTDVGDGIFFSASYITRKKVEGSDDQYILERVDGGGTCIRGYIKKMTKRVYSFDEILNALANTWEHDLGRPPSGKNWEQVVTALTDSAKKSIKLIPTL